MSSFINSSQFSLQMAEPMLIDLDAKLPPSKDPKPNRPRNGWSRKKVISMLQNLKTAEEKQAFVESLEKELEGLFSYYREVMDQKVSIELGECGSRNGVVAALIEESELPLSKLVDEIHDKLKNGDNAAAVEQVTHASVKSSVLMLGQRMMYGVANADADILEDQSKSCFWCWETRDMKLIPKSVRGQFVVRRTCRKRIHERITAVSEMISSMKNLESERNYNKGILKASTKLGKAITEADIRLLVDGLFQKNSIDMDKKKANLEEKLLVKQLERNRRESEKEKESMTSEMKREMQPGELDSKLLQGEAQNDEKSGEKRKQQKQADEAVKSQRRREKEEAELKKKRSIQKQASLMERFLKRTKTDSNPAFQNDDVPPKEIAPDLSSNKSESVTDSATLSMDSTFASSSEIVLENIRKLHFSTWRNLGQLIRSNRKQRWGLRQKPRTEIFKELKLTGSKSDANYDELGMEGLEDRPGECSSDIGSSPMNVDSSPPEAKKYSRAKQLLQFDKAHRPAFYGIWPTKSNAVGPRHPLRKDPILDYDANSDEEWEEEEPGESLSDCDKDEDESPEDCPKSDEESEDGFFVPDGYLSEDEGAQAEGMEIDIETEGVDSTPSSKDDSENEEFYALLRHQKYLNSLTEHALRKNQPLIITNLTHNQGLLLDRSLSGTPKQEQTFLQALSMCVIPGGSYIEISIEKVQDEDHETSLPNDKGGATPLSDMAPILDSDLPIIVTTIQNCSQSINKVLGSLQQKFPSVSKSLLKNKVREVSDYVDNRWQVKKEVLLKLGLPVNPDAEKRSIAAFFFKRCLPPVDGSMRPGEISPISSLKSHSGSNQEQQQSSYNI
ncbi:chromatin assembly factor 1 subunit FAS1 isoform X1 [Arachis hypogaea]|uniref:chromatin assembly factor 1 subunit FAS1 isoform X1 n=1 Tax=Arachis hypogaea TaxID=3818 RepID=UPI000DECCF7B|nr:chromatin assembly factor 1 subunit FAS1 isoform X1 [Arachis hypogaea]